jgi:hypothetical protein
MFAWFISPWEAARLSLEAQRLMVFPFLYFASGQQRRRQVLSDREQTLVPPLVDQSVVDRVQPAIPTRSMATGRRKTVPARKAREVIRKPMNGNKGKGKRSIGKGRRAK